MALLFSLSSRKTFFGACFICQMYSKLWRRRFLGSENFHSGRTGREVGDSQLRKQNNSSLRLIFLRIMSQLWFVRVLSTIEVFISLGLNY